jgi:hypothetical protein
MGDSVAAPTAARDPLLVKRVTRVAGRRLAWPDVPSGRIGRGCMWLDVASCSVSGGNVSYAGLCLN